MQDPDYKSLYQAEREKRLAMEADVKAVAKTLSPVVNRMTDGKGKISEMKALTVLPALLVDQKFKQSITAILPRLMKYEHLVKDNV
jgi:CO dehydrogenase nickel-insertion accessory protein CooC1